jgi:UDP-N-acetylmuramyl pentapeptide synthase
MTKARARIAELRASGTVFVAIAGSYGKTSQKEILAHVLSSGLRVFAPSGTLNTPLGIAQALGAMPPGAAPQVFVTEMGEHYRGDIEELVQLVDPDIGIVSGITHQHLDRMGSIENVIDTIFELPLSMREDTVCYMDRADIYSARGIEKHTRASAVIKALDTDRIGDYRALADFEGGEFSYAGLVLRT